MSKKPLITGFFYLLTCFFSISIASADLQSLVSITVQTETFLNNYSYSSPYPARFKLSQLDSRLKLKACHKPLDITFSNTQKVTGNTSLKVRCNAPVKWQLHLPIIVDIYDDVLVSKKPILRGQNIDEKSVQFRKMNVSRLHQGYYKLSDDIKKLQAKRNLAANTVLTPGNLKPQLLIKTGQRVTIVLQLKGLQIKSTGLALQSASMGQLIKVRNTQSNKVIEGTVSSEAQITVRL